MWTTASQLFSKLFFYFINQYHTFYQQHNFHFLGMFAKIGKTLHHVCPSVRPHGTSQLPLDEFPLHLIFEYFSKILPWKSHFIKIWWPMRNLHNTNIHIWSYLAQFFLEWEVFQTKVVEKIKTHILRSVTFSFLKSCHVWDNVEKYSRARETTDDMVHAHFMPDTYDYKHTYTRLDM